MRQRALIAVVLVWLTGLAVQVQAGGSARVAGRVLLPDGSVPADVSVTLIPETSQALPQVGSGSHPTARRDRRTTRLENDGRYVFEGVETGRWALQVTGAGIVAPAWYFLRFRVSEGEAASLDVTVYRGGTVTGRVLDAETGRPIAGAQLWHDEQHPRVRTRSGPEGRYRLGPVMPGTRFIVSSAAGYVGGGGRVTVRDSGTTHVDIRLRRGGTIVGTVVQPDGRTPAAGAVGRLEPLGPAGRSAGAVLGAHTGEDGTFSTDPEPPGAYRLSFEWPFGKGVKATHRGTLPRVVVSPGRAARVTVKLSPIR